MAAEIKATFAGTWESVKSEVSDEFYTKLGTGPVTKQFSPTMVISVDGETISVTVTADSKVVSSTSSKLGEECEITREGENAGKGVTTYSGGKMFTTLTQNGPNKKTVDIVRELVDGQLVQTMTVDGIESKRYFNKK